MNQHNPHAKMKQVWTEALDRVRGDDEATAAYRLFLYLLDHGLVSTPSLAGYLAGIKTELAKLEESTPRGNWKVKVLEERCPCLWHCISSLLQSFEVLREIMGHLRTSFKHSPDTVFWLDAAWDLMEKKAWEVSEEKAARLRYYIALDLFEYAPKDGITEVSGLIREHLSELSELKKLYQQHHNDANAGAWSAMRLRKNSHSPQPGSSTQQSLSHSVFSPVSRRQASQRLI